MKYLVFFFLLLFCINTKTICQDVTFSQWEQMPIYFNPALTGDFEGMLRFRVKYRDQWRSFLEEDAFKTGIGSAEYKFAKGGQRKFSLGFFTLNDRGGSSNFTANSYILSTSVIQNLGNSDAAHHSLALGINVGLVARKVDLSMLQIDPIQVPIPTEVLNVKRQYVDIGIGLNWNYQAQSHFSTQFGIALHHVNRPDKSFSQAINQPLDIRLNLHGNIEIPIIEKISLVPSFLFYTQGPSEQLLFGLSSKWYLKNVNQNFIQLGFFAKNTANFDGRSINAYVASATIEINSFLVGFAFDRFTKILDGSNAYEFTLGYVIGKKHKQEGN